MAGERVAQGGILKYACSANTEYRRTEMTVCPIAIVVGCKKCPAFAVCPLKGIIGDYKKEDEAPTQQQADKAKRDEKRPE